MNVQWEKAEAIKEQAVEGAAGSLWKKIKDEYALDKEKAIAEALTLARVSIIFLTKIGTLNSFIKKTITELLLPPANEVCPQGGFSLTETPHGQRPSPRTETLPPWIEDGNERAVRILLECILVF